jgi:predicted kinase
VLILDCIEFAARFRFADVAADVAFLSMDLAGHRRVDLAERFLAAYAREANDFDLFPLVDFYESYRAYVRAKVASLLAADPGAGAEERRRAQAEARRHYLLALASERRALMPASVVAVGGILASGKTTVAGELGAALGAPVVDADRTRKHLAGVAAGEPLHHPPWQGAYTPEATERVYLELLRRAGAVLASGRPVVLDASFRSRRQRLAARRLAALSGVPFTFVECRAEPSLCRERLARRAAERGPSDGRLAIFDDFLAAWEPVVELPAAEHVALDTSLPLGANLETLRGRLPAWPPGLTG